MHGNARVKWLKWDASIFDWLGNVSYLHLHCAINDATGRILALYFEKEETLEGYCELCPIFKKGNFCINQFFQLT